MSNPDWKIFKEVDFNDKSIMQYHVDTRDFHCFSKKEVRCEKEQSLDVETLKKYGDRFLYTPKEVMQILERLFNESGGSKRDWRFLSLINPKNKDEYGNDWSLKYFRIFREDDKFIVCDKYRGALKRDILMNYIVNKEEV